MGEHDSQELQAHDNTNHLVENTDSSGQGLSWESRLGRYLVMLILGLVGGSFTLAIFLSVYTSITTPPKVWGVPPTPQKPAHLMTRSQIQICRQHLERLSAEQLRETTSLWYRMNQGHRGHLTLWQEWSRDWHRRMNQLLQQCPMRSKTPPFTEKTQTLSLRTCTQQFNKLNQELQRKSSSLWLKTRQGPSHYLKGWQDWSQFWQRRMQLWQQRCPIHGEGEIVLAFRRAHTQMLALQRQQEKALITFFSQSADLFRDIRQALHGLKEELR
jgi:hypothetical protein